MIKARFLCFWLGLCFMISSQISYAHFHFWQRLIPKNKSPQVQLMVHEEKGELKAILSVKNNLNHPILLEKEKLGISGTIMTEVFFILADGKPLSPNFPALKRPPPTKNDFIILEPNQIIKTEVSLNQAYHFPSGLHFYQVFYDASHSTQQGNLLFLRTLATPFFYNQDPRLTPTPQYKLAAEATVAEVGTDSQKKAIESALLEQKNMLNQKITDLETENWNKDAKIRNHFKIWFGKTNEDSRKHIQNILKAMLQRNKITTLQNFQIGSDRIAYAHVFADDPTHIITLFEIFFKAPDKGTNSKPGVLCHEMSHFIDVAGALDRSYGTRNSKQLGLDDSEGAMNNADNIEYYLENAN